MTIHMTSEVAYAVFASETNQARKPLGSANYQRFGKQCSRTGTPSKASIVNNFIDKTEYALLAVSVGSAVSCATRHACSSGNSGFLPASLHSVLRSTCVVADIPSLDETQGQAKSEVRAAGLRNVHAAASRPAIVRAVAPTAAAKHAGQAFYCSLRIGSW